MLAALYRIKAFARSNSNLHILLLIDNITTVAHINRLGGTKSQVLVQIVKELWQWCLNQGITLTAQHLPGLQNIRADFMLRYLTDRSDRMLNPHLFTLLNQRWGPFETDLFATRLTRQLPVFLSWRPDPDSAGVDTVSQDWSQSAGFAHPPCCLIGRTLQKVIAQRATITLIAPVWQSQPWYPTLLSLLVDYPQLLPRGPQTLWPSQNCGVPMENHCPQLVAWKVSGDNCRQEEFRCRLQTSSSGHGEPRQTPTTTRHGGNGPNCAIVELKILLKLCRIIPGISSPAVRSG